MAFYLFNDQSIVQLVYSDLILDLLSAFVIANPPINNGEVAKGVLGSIFKAYIERG
jgi:hypothetical protein